MNYTQESRINRAFLRKAQQDLTAQLNLYEMRRSTLLGLASYLNTILFAIGRRYGLIRKTHHHYEIVSDRVSVVVNLAAQNKLSVTCAIKFVANHASRYWQGASSSRDTYRRRRDEITALEIWQCETNPEAYWQDKRCYYCPPLESIDLMRLLALAEAVERVFVLRWGWDAWSEATKEHMAALTKLIFDAIFGITHEPVEILYHRKIDEVWDEFVGSLFGILLSDSS